eukprot:63137-Chlamydomonas_euryale.AAC.1
MAHGAFLSAIPSTFHWMTQRRACVSTTSDSYYPTSISESPDHPDAFLISIGEMDCTSHVVKVDRQDVLDVVNGLMLQSLNASR